MNITSGSNPSINGEYFYIRNLQGDIIGLIDKNGTEVVSYTYDTWGKPISIEGSLKDTVGVKNPYRYRGYRYDTETGLYYLNARYYNPEWGRFINADEYVGQVGTLLSSNMFAYCLNNPVNLHDPSGSWFALTFPLLGQVATGILSTITAVVSSPVVIGVALVAAGGLLVYAGLKYIKSKVNTDGVNAGSASDIETSGPYSDLEDSSGVTDGRDFTPTQKKKIIDVNKERNGGEVKSDDPSDPFPNLVKPSKSTKGVTPPPNEWQIDHIKPKSKGGTNSYGNARVVSRYLNRLKWDK